MMPRLRSSTGSSSLAAPLPPPHKSCTSTHLRIERLLDQVLRALSVLLAHLASSFSPCRISVAVSAPSPALRAAAAMAAAACGWP